MTNSDRPVTNDKIYELVDRMRVELTRKIDETSRDHKSELTDLRRQFENLEAGRLTRAEGNIQDLRVYLLKARDALKENQAVMDTKVIIMLALGNILIVVIVEALVRKFIK